MASRDRIYLQKYILIESGCHDFTGAIIDVRKKRANECMCVKEKERKKDRSERERETGNKRELERNKERQNGKIQYLCSSQ